MRGGEETPPRGRSESESEGTHIGGEPPRPPNGEDELYEGGKDGGKEGEDEWGKGRCGNGKKIRISVGRRSAAWQG